MTAKRSRNGIAMVCLTWFLTGMVAIVPLWFVTGIGAAVFGGLGPLGVLAYKPGENLPGKLVLVVLGALPVVLGALWVRHRWASLRPRAQLLLVAGLSAIWHGPSAALMVIVLAGLN